MRTEGLTRVARRLLVLGVLGGASTAFAGPCVIDTLANYVALGGAGCTISGEIADNFAFSVLSASGGYTPLNDTQITVTPTFSASQYNLMFSSTGFSVVGSEFVHYEIDFTWDPVVIGGEDEMITHSPVFPGLAKVTTDLCAGSTFGALCPPPTNTLTVFHDGVSPHLTDVTFFAPTTLIGTQSFIDLEANGASANMDGFITSVFAPEPATAGLLLAAALTGLVRRRRRAS